MKVLSCCDCAWRAGRSDCHWRLHGVMFRNETRKPAINGSPVAHKTRNLEPMPRPYKAKGRYRVVEIDGRAWLMDRRDRITILRGATVKFDGATTLGSDPF